MRKLIMWNIITLDGFFEATKNWDLPFHNIVWGDELDRFSIEQLRSAEYLAFGRVTYQGMEMYWTNAEIEHNDLEVAKLMNSIPKLVFSNTLKSVEWNNTKLVTGNASTEMKRFKEDGDGDIYVFGSSLLCESFINDGLFDEYRICIAPVILGKGRKLFKNCIEPKNLKLLSTQNLSTGGVILKYSK